MSLIVLFTNAVFALQIQSAPAVTGPWTELVTSRNPCAETHSLSVNTTEPMKFFRFIPLDNGLAPTPQSPDVYFYNEKLHLVCPPLYECPSNPIVEYRWYRDGQLIATTTEPAAEIDNLIGLHLYQVQVRTADGLSWLSNYSSL